MPLDVQWLCSQTTSPSVSKPVIPDESPVASSRTEKNPLGSNSHLGSNMPPPAVTTPDPEDIKLLLAQSQKLQATVDAFAAETTALTTSVKFFSDQYDELLKTVNTLKSENADCKKRIATLEAEKTALKTGHREVKNHLQQLDQYGLNRNVEIHGVDERQDEDPRTLVTEIIKLLHVSITDKEIDVVHRLGKPSPASAVARSRPRPIIVQFTNRSARQRLLEKKKTALTSFNLVQNGNNRSSIYIYENLSPHFKHLLWKARQCAPENGFQSCWYRNGMILVKKTRDGTDPTYQIRDHEDLNARLPQQAALKGNVGSHTMIGNA